MTDFKELIKNRRSHRRFIDEPVSDDDMRLIMRAALMSPTSKGLRSWQFVVVNDKKKIETISQAKPSGAQFMAEAPVVVVVMGQPTNTECWIEDCSVAAFAIMLQAEDLGLGSCWVQFRGRKFANGTTSDARLHSILNLPDDNEVLCAIAIGHKADERKPQNEERLKWDNVKGI